MPDELEENMHRRVLLVVPQPFYSDRGSPIAMREVVRAYLALGQEVDVVTFPMGDDFDGHGLRFFRAANPFGIRWLPVGFSLRKLLLDLTLTWRLRDRLRSGPYDLVHALEEAAFPAVWLAKAHGIPVLYDMHSRLSDGLIGVPGLGSGPLRAAAIRIEEWLFRNAGVIVTSKGLARRVREVHPSARLFEWHFPGTLDGEPARSPGDIREALSIAPDAPVVLYSGTFTRYQGVELLLEAAAIVAPHVPAAVFVLVGSEPREDRRIRELVEELTIEERVRIVPRRPREEMGRYFAAADVLVSLRVSGENVPLKVFDYLSADRAIVATDVPTHRTVLDENTALFAPPTPEGLAEALTRILEDPELADRLRRGARRYARTRLGRPAFVQALQEIHRTAVTGS